MKRYITVGLTFLLILFTIGCGTKPLNEGTVAVSNNEQNSSGAVVSSSGGSLGASEGVVSSAAGDTISVSGSSSRISLHSVDFIDENTGWIIGDEYNSTKPASRILRTNDAGKNWEETTLNNMAADKLMFVDKTTGWVITHADNVKTIDTVQTSTMRILNTEDGGKSFSVQWEQSLETPASCELWFQDKQNGYALIGGLVLSTRDGGKQWSKVSSGVEGFIPQHMDFVNSDIGWIIGTVQPKGEQGLSTQSSEIKLLVLQTKDGGNTWKKQFEKKYSDGPIGTIDIDFADSSNGWFLTSDMASWNGELYYTFNSGASWEKINDIKCVRPTPSKLDFVNPKTGWIPLDVGAGPIDGGLMLTHDGGKSFESVNNNNRLTSVHDVDFTSLEKGWAVGEAINYGDFLVHTTDGGKSWAQVYPSIRPIRDISFVDNLHGFGLWQLSDLGALLYTDDGGKSWSKIMNFPLDYNTSRISFVDRKNGWVLAQPLDTQKVAILKTNDGGATWTLSQIDNSPTPTPYPVYFRFFGLDKGIIVSESVDSIIYYRTKDSGKSWQSNTQPKQKNAVCQYFFASDILGWKNDLSYNGRTVDISIMKDDAAWQSLGRIGSNTWSYGMDFISKDKGWMLTQEQPFQEDSIMKLLTTCDGGQNWSAHPFPKGFRLDYYDGQLPIQFTDDNHGWILSMQGLLGTEDGGKTWTWR